MNPLKIQPRRDKKMWMLIVICTLLKGRTNPQWQCKPFPIKFTIQVQSSNPSWESSSSYLHSDFRLLLILYDGL